MQSKGQTDFAVDRRRGFDGHPPVDIEAGVAAR